MQQSIKDGGCHHRVAEALEVGQLLKHSLEFVLSVRFEVTPSSIAQVKMLMTAGIMNDEVLVKHWPANRKSALALDIFKCKTMTFPRSLPH